MLCCSFNLVTAAIALITTAGRLPERKEVKMGHIANWQVFEFFSIFLGHSVNLFGNFRIKKNVCLIFNPLKVRRKSVFFMRINIRLFIFWVNYHQISDPLLKVEYGFILKVTSFERQLIERNSEETVKSYYIRISA